MSEVKDRYSYQEAEEEAAKLKEKIKSGKAYGYAGAEEIVNDETKFENWLTNEYENEHNREALKKVVDLFDTEDLKYRYESIEQIPITLEVGVPTPLIDFLRKPLGRVTKQTLSETRSKKSEREAMSIQNSPTNPEYSKYREYRQTANVYYPEGILKFVRSEINGAQAPMLFSREEAGRARYEGMTCMYAVLERLKWNHEFCELLGVSLKQITETEQKWNYQEPKERVTTIKNLLKNAPPQAWEMIRREWLEYFFEGGNEIGGAGGYNLNYGFVISPKVRVGISPHGDYPTQATILESRIKPRDIIGLIVDGRKHDFTIFHPKSLEAISPSGDHRNISTKTQLENSFFHVPQNPVEYLLENYSRPFMYFLETNGVELITLKQHYVKFSKAVSTLPNEGPGFSESEGGKKAITERAIKRSFELSDRFRILSAMSSMSN